MLLACSLAHQPCEIVEAVEHCDLSAEDALRGAGSDYNLHSLKTIKLFVLYTGSTFPTIALRLVSCCSLLRSATDLVGCRAVETCLAFARAGPLPRQLASRGAASPALHMQKEH